MYVEHKSRAHIFIQHTYIIAALKLEQIPPTKGTSGRYIFTLWIMNSDSK